MTTPTAPLHSAGVPEDTPWCAVNSENVEGDGGLHTPRPGWWARLRGYWELPSVLTEPPPSMTQLAAYARTGAWTTSRKGFVRSLGVWWYRAALIPTVICRYAEWALQRPGRALAFWVFWRLLYSTGGPAFHHFIAFFLRLAARVLL